MNNQDKQNWDAAATEAGYLPVSDYVETWKTARAVYEAAVEANIKAMDALEQATIAYHDSVNRWLTRIGGNRP
jgi:hypothetical protein